MKKTIKKYKFVKELVDNYEIDLPEVPICYQEHNYRVLYALIPKFLRADTKDKKLYNEERTKVLVEKLKMF